MLVDRRLTNCGGSLTRDASFLHCRGLNQDPEHEDGERVWRLHDRWKYDADDSPSAGVDTVLIDDYSSRLVLVKLVTQRG
jgi:hypothetical protein